MRHWWGLTFHGAIFLLQLFEFSRIVSSQKKAVGVGRTSNSSLRALTRLLLESSISARTQFQVSTSNTTSSRWTMYDMRTSDRGWGHSIEGLTLLGFCLFCIFFAFASSAQWETAAGGTFRTYYSTTPSTTACDAPTLLKNCTTSKWKANPWCFLL